MSALPERTGKAMNKQFVMDEKASSQTISTARNVTDTGNSECEGNPNKSSLAFDDLSLSALEICGSVDSSITDNDDEKMRRSLQELSEKLATKNLTFDQLKRAMEITLLKESNHDAELALGKVVTARETVRSLKLHQSTPVSVEYSNSSQPSTSAASSDISSSINCDSNLTMTKIKKTTGMK